MEEILQASCRDDQSKSFLTGWIDYEDERHFEADLKIKKMRNEKLQMRNKILKSYK